LGRQESGTEEQVGEEAGWTAAAAAVAAVAAIEAVAAVAAAAAVAPLVVYIGGLAITVLGTVSFVRMKGAGSSLLEPAGDAPPGLLLLHIHSQPHLVTLQELPQW
jgi:hypothetical protein